MGFLGSNRSRQILVDQYLQPRPGDRMLDISCGAGVILEFLSNSIEYHGIDLSQQYIASAESRFAERGNFQLGDVNHLEPRTDVGFDIVMAPGLLHHLEDDEVCKLTNTVARLMATDGRFITLDNCFTSDQSTIARTLIRWDRGQNVRRPEEYRALIGEVSQHVECDIRNDLLRFPYTHVILEATREIPKSGLDPSD